MLSVPAINLRDNVVMITLFRLSCIVRSFDDMRGNGEILKQSADTQNPFLIGEKTNVSCNSHCILTSSFTISRLHLRKYHELLHGHLTIAFSQFHFLVV